MSEIKKYFDTQSSNYEFKSNNFPWSFIRNKENIFFIKAASTTKNKNILDLGSGSGYYTKLFSKNNNLYAVDISSQMLNNLPTKNINPILADAAEVKINKKFDLILIAGLLEFVDNFEKVLRNAEKHLKNNSNLILLFPRNNIFGKMYKLFHKKNNIEIKLFSISEIEQILSNLNISIIEKKSIFPFSATIIAKKKISN